MPLFRLPFCGLLLYYIKNVDTTSVRGSGAIDCLD